jgi:hypothetical protein
MIPTPPNPFWQKKLNDGGRQFQFTLFYRLLPSCGRIGAAALAQIGTQSGLAALARKHRAGLRGRAPNFRVLLKLCIDFS